MSQRLIFIITGITLIISTLFIMILLPLKNSTWSVLGLFVLAAGIGLVVWSFSIKDNSSDVWV